MSLCTLGWFGSFQQLTAGPNHPLP